MITDSVFALMFVTPFSLLQAGPAQKTADAVHAIQVEIASSEYRFSELDGVATAPNRAQGLRTGCGTEGIVVRPWGAGAKGDASEWELRLDLVAWGRGDQVDAAPIAAVGVDRHRAELRRRGLVEWLVNEPERIEHGFSIPSPPSAPLANRPLVLQLTITGGLTASVTEDGLSARFRSGTDEVLRYSGLLVLDADGAEVPAQLVVSPGHLEIHVHDRGARYPIEVDPILTNPAWATQGNQVGAALGTSVSTAGDVNGDGFSDVIVGAPYYNTFNPDDGQFFVYHGTPSGTSFSLAYSYSDFQGGARMGASVSTAGDVNGDGYDDVIVGESHLTTSLSTEGRAHVFLGSASGLTGGPDWQYYGGMANALLGTSVSCAGDVNDDGYDDVIIGAKGMNTHAGRALVFHGSAAGLGPNPAWTASGINANDELGTSVSGAGDIDGDGYGDVVIGIPNLLFSGTLHFGSADFYLGSAAGLSNTPISRGAGSFYTRYGHSVSRAGDVNGDGYADVIIGEPYYQSGQAEEGRALIYLGTASGPDVPPAWQFEPNFVKAHCGASVSTAGDVNGDGYADVIVGAPGHAGTGVKGQAWVFQGNAALTLPARWYGWSPAPSEYGISVGTAGDVDGDGFSDVLVGAPGYAVGESQEGGAWVYHGSGSKNSIEAWAYSVEGSGPGTFFGRATTIIGDQVGSGLDNFAVGAPYEDNFRGYVRVYSGDVELNHSLAWTLAGENEGDYFGFSVDGAGDVNGDGYDDFVVGAPFWDGAFNAQGKAYLYLGSAAGMQTTPAWTFEGDVAVAQFGFSVSGGGDHNGDGYADVIVGSPTEQGLGRAFVFFGSASGLSTTPDWMVEGGDVGGKFGYSVDGEGDLNGDGYSDLLVGAPDVDWPSGSTQAGRAYLYLGSPAGPTPGQNWSAAGTTVGHFGEALAFVGDTNGDGLSDFVIGAPWQSWGQTTEGRVVLWLGDASGVPANTGWAVEGNLDSAWFGSSVGAAGDVNGDGFGDFVVGAPNFASVGRGYLYLGAASLPSTNAAWEYTPPTSDWIAAGYGMSGGGDVNGDGFADFLMGMPTYVHTSLPSGRTGILYGNSHDTVFPPELDRRPRQLQLDGSADIGLLGIADPTNGFELGMVGRSPAGREDVGLEWEVRPFGTPFTGVVTGTGIVSHDTGVPGALGSHVPLSEDVLGLFATESYHWRARITSRNPYFPRSPWLSAPGNDLTELKFRTIPQGDGSDRMPPRDQRRPQ